MQRSPEGTALLPGNAAHSRTGAARWSTCRRLRSTRPPPRPASKGPATFIWSGWMYERWAALATPPLADLHRAAVRTAPPPRAHPTCSPAYFKSVLSFQRCIKQCGQPSAHPAGWLGAAGGRQAGGGGRRPAAAPAASEPSRDAELTSNVFNRSVRVSSVKRGSFSRARQRARLLLAAGRHARHAAPPRPPGIGARPLGRPVPSSTALPRLPPRSCRRTSPALSPNLRFWERKGSGGHEEEAAAQTDTSMGEEVRGRAAMGPPCRCSAPSSEPPTPSLSLRSLRPPPPLPEAWSRSVRGRGRLRGDPRRECAAARAAGGGPPTSAAAAGTCFGARRALLFHHPSLPPPFPAR